MAGFRCVRTCNGKEANWKASRSEADCPERWVAGSSPVFAASIMCDSQQKEELPSVADALTALLAEEFVYSVGAGVVAQVIGAPSSRLKKAARHLLRSAFMACAVGAIIGPWYWASRSFAVAS